MESDDVFGYIIIRIPVKYTWITEDSFNQSSDKRLIDVFAYECGGNLEDAMFTVERNASNTIQ